MRVGEGRRAGWARLGAAGLCALAVLGGLCACGATLHGSFQGGIFRHEVFGYQLRSRFQNGFVPITREWKVDNVRLERGKLWSKKGPDYEAEYFLDINDDGKAESLGKFFIYDLRFVNTRGAGVVWLRTIPIHPDDANRDLRVMAESYVAAMAGTHYETAQLEGNLYRTTTERTFATNIVQRAAGQVAGLPGYGVVVDVADVAQLELNPNARHQRVALLFIRTPFVWELGHRKVPVLMIAGYADLDTDFDPEARPLIAMLQRLKVGDSYGVNLDLRPPAAAPAEPAPAPAAPVVADGGTPDGSAPTPAPAATGAAPAAAQPGPPAEPAPP